MTVDLHLIRSVSQLVIRKRFGGNSAGQGIRERGGISIFIEQSGGYCSQHWRRIRPSASVMFGSNSEEAWIPKPTRRQINLELKSITHEHTENVCTSG